VVKKDSGQLKKGKKEVKLRRAVPGGKKEGKKRRGGNIGGIGPVGGNLAGKNEAGRK